MFGPAPSTPPKFESLMADAAFRESYEHGCDIAVRAVGWRRSPAASGKQAAGPGFESHSIHEMIVQIALYDALTAHQRTFSAVAGVSMGEFAAAYAAGAVSREDAVRLGSHVVRVSLAANDGDLLAIHAPAERANAALRGHFDRFCSEWGRESHLAVRHSEMAAVKRALDAAGIRFTNLNLGCMPHIDAGHRQDFIDSLDGITGRTPVVPYYTCVSGGRLEKAADTGFWTDMCFLPSQFSSVMAALRADGLDHVVYAGTVDFKYLAVAVEEAERPRTTPARKLLPRFRRRRVRTT